MSVVRSFSNTNCFRQFIYLFSFTLMLTISCAQENTVGENLTGEVLGNIRYVNVALSNYQFEPRTYQLRQGDTVEFNLESYDGIHTFSIEQLDIDWVIDSDKPQTQRFIFAEPGKYKLICLIPPHDSLGMIGTVIVK